MRLPQSCYDKGLLEDEPFLSAFKARQLAAPPTRGAGPAGVDDDDASDEAIANEIRNMNLVSLFILSTFYKQFHRRQLSTVQVWIDLAFRPHYWLNSYKEIKAHDPGMIIFFVKFYWALSHSHEDASGILQAALKEKGYGYISEGDVTVESTTDLTKQVHPNQISQIGDDAFQSLSNEVPGIPRDIELQKNLNPNMDLPDYQGQERGFLLQTCPPSLVPTALSVTPQIESEQVAPNQSFLIGDDAFQSLSNEAPGSTPRNIEFQKILNAKMDVLDCPEEGASSTQFCPPSLDPTSSSVTLRIESKQMHPNQISQIGEDAFQSLLNEVFGSLPRDIEFQKIFNAKKDVPNCPEQAEESFSQTCPPSLDPTLLSVMPQIEFNPFPQLPLPQDSWNTMAICDLPKKRKGRQVSPDRRRIKHRKFNEATSDTSKLCNVSQVGNDVIDEKTKACPSQHEDISDKADHVSDGALYGQPPLKKVPPRGPKVNRNLRAKKDVPDCPEQEANSSSQTFSPSLDPTSSSATPQIGSILSSTQLPLPTDSRKATAMPKKRKGRQVSPDRRRIKHQKIIEATSDISKLCNVSQARNDDIDEKTKAQSSQCEDVSDKANHVSDGALYSQPPLKKVPGRIPPGLKFIKNTSAKKDVLDCPEQEGKSSSQTCPPSLESSSLSATRVIESIPPASPLPPDSQNTTDLPKPRKRQTSPDTPQKEHRGVNEATSDASKLGDNNDLEPHSKACHIEEAKLKIICRPGASSTSESTRIELNKTILFRSNTPEPTNLAINKRPPKVKEEQEDSASLTVQPVSRKKRGGRPPKVNEGREGSASLTVQPVPRKKKGRPLKSQDQLDAGTVVPFSGQNVDMTQETSNIPFSLAQSSHDVFGLQGRFFYHDSWPLFNRGMKEGINRSENWVSMQENVLVEEGFIFEDPAATQMEDRPTNVFATHKPPLCVNPPIWAQVCDNIFRYNELSSAFLSSPAKKFVKHLIGSAAIKVVFILRTMQ
jgi:hypothetical protein